MSYFDSFNNLNLFTAVAPIKEAFLHYKKVVDLIPTICTHFSHKIPFTLQYQTFPFEKPIFIILSQILESTKVTQETETHHFSFKVNLIHSNKSKKH